MSHTPDIVTAKESSVQFSPHPEGQYPMVCVDVIDMGERVKSFVGKDPYVAHEVSLVFQSGEVNEAGRVHEVTQDFTLTMGKKGNLRPFLESWRGKSYTEAEAREGVPLHKLVGKPALVSVEHKTSANTGRTRAAIRSISPLPKGLPAPTLPEYSRPSFFLERIAKYQAEVAEFNKSKKVAESTLADVPVGLAEPEDNDDLPF